MRARYPGSRSRRVGFEGQIPGASVVVLHTLNYSASLTLSDMNQTSRGQAGFLGPSIHCASHPPRMHLPALEARKIYFTVTL